MEISQLDRVYFTKNILEINHGFQFVESSLECRNCQLSFGSFMNEMNCFKQFYFDKSDFLTFRVNQNGKNDFGNVNSHFEYTSLETVRDDSGKVSRVKTIRTESLSYKSNTAMSGRFFNLFKIKFIDKSYDCCSVKLALDM